MKPDTRMSHNTPAPCAPSESATQIQRVMRRFGKFMLLLALVHAGTAGIVTTPILSN